jgi:vancomycin permeability regulator SanA
MVARALAAFFGGFTLVNLAGSAVRRHFDCNLWWIDLRPLPAPVAAAVLLVAAVALLSYAVRVPVPRSRRGRTTAITTATLLAFAVANSVHFYVLLATGHIRSGVPLPLSALIVGALGWVLYRVLVPAEPPTETVRPLPSRLRRGLPFAATFAACLVVLPLAQMVLFGETDYRRPADAIVVFGARVYGDGTPSLALSDRVATACRLYHEGWARTLVFSGGPGDGLIDEPQAMRRQALRLGVPDSAIRLDADGVNTERTVHNTASALARGKSARLLAVSHSYHLPRIKMSYQRAGWESVYTVPAEETRTLSRLPFLMGREVVALWVYYIRPPSSDHGR